MPSFETTLEAEDDLRGIISYTAERWGADQVRKYMSGIENHMELMAVGMAHVRSLDDLISGLKVGRYERHVIFAVDRIDEPMLILAIFHEKMDVIDRLKSRL